MSCEVVPYITGEDLLNELSDGQPCLPMFDGRPVPTRDLVEVEQVCAAIGLETLYDTHARTLAVLTWEADSQEHIPETTVVFDEEGRVVSRTLIESWSEGMRKKRIYHFYEGTGKLAELTVSWQLGESAPQVYRHVAPDHYPTLLKHDAPELVFCDDLNQLQPHKASLLTPVDESGAIQVYARPAGPGRKEFGVSVAENELVLHTQDGSPLAVHAYAGEPGAQTRELVYLNPIGNLVLRRCKHDEFIWMIVEPEVQGSTHVPESGLKQLTWRVASTLFDQQNK